MGSPSIRRLSRNQRRLVKRYGKPLEDLLREWYWQERCPGPRQHERCPGAGHLLTVDQVAKDRAQVGRTQILQWLTCYGLTRKAVAAREPLPVPA